MEHDKTMIKGTQTEPVSEPKIFQYAVGINREFDDDPQEDSCTSEIDKQLRDLVTSADTPNGDRAAVSLHIFAGEMEKETEAKQKQNRNKVQ